MPTIFTRIIQWEIPSHKVYEDDKCYAFLDVNPVTKGHTLLVPKEEYVRMTDAPDELVAHLYIIAKKLMIDMKARLGVDYVYLAVEGLAVPHFHIHLVPNNSNEERWTFTHITYDEGEAEQIAKKIAWI